MSEWWGSEGYLYGREVALDLWICVAGMLTTWRIMLCDPYFSVHEFWCYPKTEFSPHVVVLYAEAFSGVGDPHEGWVKHHPSHRRPRDVGMLDLATDVLHRPGSEHMVTACGISLDNTTVGPGALCGATGRAAL